MPILIQTYQIYISDEMVIAESPDNFEIFEGFCRAGNPVPDINEAALLTVS